MMQKEALRLVNDCALAGVKAGGAVCSFALNKTSYRLDDREKPVDYAGQKVTIIGPCNKNNPRSIDSSRALELPHSYIFRGF
jgi:hypothetical protein